MQREILNVQGGLDGIATGLVEQLEQLLDKLSSKNNLTINLQLVEAIVGTLEILLSTLRKGLYNKDIFLKLPFQRFQRLEKKDELLPYIVEPILCERLGKWCNQAVEIIKEYINSDPKSTYGEALPLIFLLRTELTELLNRLILKMASSKNHREETLSELADMNYRTARDAMAAAAEALAWAKKYPANNAIQNAQYKIAQLEAHFIYTFSHEAIYEQFDCIPLEPQFYIELFTRIKSIGLHLMDHGEWFAAWDFFRTLRNKQEKYSFIDNELLRLAFISNENLLQAQKESIEKKNSIIKNSDAYRYRELLKKARDLAPRERATVMAVCQQQKLFSQAIDDQLLKTILHDCESLLGPPPRSFIVFALGSTSETMQTCFSDFEYTIIVAGEEKISEKERIYIERFSQLFEFKMLSIGEPEGFRLEAMIEGNVAREGCWGRVSDLIKRITNTKDLTSPIVHSLLQPRRIYSAKATQDTDPDIEQLQKSYQWAVRNLETNVVQEELLSQAQQRALAHLSLYLEPKLSNFDDCHAKHDLAQPLLFVFQALGYFYDIQADNPWDRLRQLTALSPIFKDELLQVLADFLVLRNQLQTHYGKQEERFQLISSAKNMQQRSFQPCVLSEEWEARLPMIVTNVLQPFYQWIKQLFCYAEGKRRPIADTVMQLRLTYQHDPAEQRHLIEDFVNHCIGSSTNTTNVTVSFINEQNNSSLQSFKLQNSLKKEILMEEGKFKKITPKLLQNDSRLKVFGSKHFESRRAVWPIFNKSGEPILYLKAYPEIPGLEIAYGFLARLLFEQESPACLLLKWEFKSPKDGTTTVYPVLASRAIRGINLADLLEDPKLFSVFLQTWQRSNREHLFVLALLTNPEDGRPNNFIAEIEKIENGNLNYHQGKYHYSREGGLYRLTGRLIPVDNDHSFFPAVSKEKIPNTNELTSVLKVKTILYCFDAVATTSLSEETIERLLSIDPIKLIETWLTQLIQIDEYFRKLFTQEEMLHLGKSPDTIKRWYNFFSVINNNSNSQDTEFNASILTIPLPFNSAVWSVYQKLQQLQSILRVWRRERHAGTLLELLIALEPLVGKRYAREFQEKKSLQQRLSAIEGLDYSTTRVAGRAHTTLKLMSTALDSVEALITTNAQGPREALKHFKTALEIQDFHAFAETFIESLVNNSPVSQSTAIDNFLARPDQHQQEILNSMNFRLWNSQQSQQAQELIANRIFGARQHQYKQLKLCNWHFLNDIGINRLLEQSPHLIYLDLTGCTALKGNVLKKIAQHTPLLKRLHLDKTSIVSLQAIFDKDHALAVLTIQFCLKLKSVKITAPRLSSLLANNCSRLSTLQVTAAPNATASLTGCSHFPDIELCSRYLNFSNCNLSSFSSNFKDELKKIISKKKVNGTNEAKWHHVVKDVRWSQKKLNDEHIKALAISLYANQQITEVDLYENQISDKGLYYLTDSLRNHPSISEVELSHNNIRDEGIAALADALKTNKSLKCIKLEHNFITDQGIEYLCEALKINSTLEVLELNFNQNISTRGGRLLYKALKVNHSLRQVGLKLTFSDPVLIAKIEELLTKRNQKERKENKDRVNGFHDTQDVVSSAEVSEEIEVKVNGLKFGL